MNNRLTPLLLLPLLLSSCAGHGYISSSINTVVGLDVSENPKTQVPHVRFGYVRSGLYYVPTGKSPGPPGSTETGSVKDTPELVSEIFVNAKFLSSVTINEKFAIGTAAVGSSAAARAFSSTAAQQVAQGAAGGSAPITHLDAPVTEKVIYNTIRTVKEAPPMPLKDVDDLMDLWTARVGKVSDPDNAPWDKLVPGTTSKAGATARVLQLRSDIQSEQDAAKKKTKTDELSGYVEKSKKPAAEW